MTSSPGKGSAGRTSAALPPSQPSPAQPATATLPELLSGRPGGGGTPQPAPPVRAWRAFRAWRRDRPFWGGLLLLLGGAEIFLTGLAPLHVIIHLGLQGLAGQAVPVVMMVCGALLIFNPPQRLFYAILGMLLSAASWITSNLGGFIFGLLLGLVGSALAFAWVPRRDPGPALDGPALDGPAGEDPAAGGPAAAGPAQRV